MNRRRTSAVFAVLWTLGVAALGLLTVGVAGALFSATFVGGFLFWMATTYHRPVDAHSIIVPYLVLAIGFIVHVYEEYISHIEDTIAQLSGFTLTQGQFLAIAAFAAPVVWLLAGVMMLRGSQFGWFLGSTFLFGMMFGEPSHFVAPFLEDGTFHYVSGMYTAPIQVALAWYLFFLLRREMRRAEAGSNREVVSPRNRQQP